MAQFVLRHSVE